MTVVQTHSGAIRICSLWEFMTEVKNHKLHEEVAVQLAHARREEYSKAKYIPQQGPPADSIYSTTSHVLRQNPLKVLTELKKTTTQKFFKAKSVDMMDMLHDLATESLVEFGEPSHFFSIGMKRYVLVCVRDVHLYVTKNYNQTLVCTAPKRNFTIYAPNLKVEL